MAEVEETPVEAPPPVAKIGMVQILILAVVAAVASAGSSVAISILIPPPPPQIVQMGEGMAPEAAAPPEVKGVANYLPLDPALVVNLDDNGTKRFLQTTVQIMTYDDEAFEAARTHSPAIRAELIMLLGTVEYQSVTTREGKEMLQETARQTVDDVLFELSGKKGIEALYLTSFVVQ